MLHMYNRTVDIYVKNDPLKELRILVRALNKIDKKFRDFIFGVCNEFIRELIDYFFMIIDLGN